MTTVTASLGAIYCYWRIEQELLNPDYSLLLARWQGDEIRGRLVNILLQCVRACVSCSRTTTQTFWKL